MATGGSSDVFLDWGADTQFVQHLLSNGDVDPAWPPNGIQLGFGPWPSRLVTDGAGGAILGTFSPAGACNDGCGGTCIDNTATAHVLVSGHLDWNLLAEGGSRAPVLAPDGTGGAFVGGWGLVIFDCYGRYDLFINHILSSGAADWETRVTDVLDNSQPPGLTPDGTGGCIVTWIDGGLNASRLGSAGQVLWSLPPQPGASSDALIADGTGGAFALWTNPSARDVYALHVLPNGVLDPAWPSGGRLVSSTSGPDDGVVATSDGTGGVIVAWTHHTPEQVFVQRLLASGSPALGWPDDGLPVSDAAASASGPALVPDNSGGLVVTWIEGGAAIFAQHVLSSGTKDPAWASRGSLVCGAPGIREPAMLTSDGAGGAVAAWSDHRAADYDVYAQHIPITGGIVNVGSTQPRARRLSLGRPHPNPMMTETRSEFALPTATDVKVEIVDLLGRRVRTLEHGWLEAGQHAIRWDGRDEHGTALPPGIYHVRVRTAMQAESRTVVLITGR
jgi:hypothetical protein